VEDSKKFGVVISTLNATFIALIAKGHKPTTPAKFRPIALCNVIYKIIKKVLANRLKPLLPILISSEQSVYVEGHQIMDNIVLTHEPIHSLKTKNNPGMLIKLDMSKAFDYLNWQYMTHVL